MRKSLANSNMRMVTSTTTPTSFTRTSIPKFELAARFMENFSKLHTATKMDKVVKIAQMRFAQIDESEGKLGSIDGVRSMEMRMTIHWLVRTLLGPVWSP